MAIGETFLVRHGRHSDMNPWLTREGREFDAVRARDTLLAWGLGSRTVVLSSDAPRAVQTAEIVADGLGAGVYRSDLIHRGGIRPIGVRNLDDLLGRALSEAGVEREDDQPLVVLTHAPLIAMAQGRSVLDESDDIAHGGVFPYQLGTWNNSLFLERFEI